jgi:hypothetical protein
MPSVATKVRVFLASPGDVAAEREHLAKVVQELNTILSALTPQQGLIVELVRWETHVHPGLGRDAQTVVNEQIGQYDIFVGIMWRRFGTPTTVAASGTEEEFRIAHRSWEDEHRLFQILFYFCQAPAPPPSTSDEIEQLSRVFEFRQELTRHGLVWDYPDHSAFADIVRPHLVMVLGRMLHGNPSRAAARDVAPVPPDSDLELARREIEGLATEYERIRGSMRPGDERTRRMEVVASRMRTLALSTTPILSELTESGSAGVRLAAVATLQAIPDARFTSWLGERVVKERPFVGYHAALALLSAARALEISDLPAVQLAVERARTTRLRRDTDREMTLSYVDAEIARRQNATGSTS